MGCSRMLFVLTVSACLLFTPIDRLLRAAELETPTFVVAQKDPPSEAKPKLVHRREDLLESDESLKTALGKRLFADSRLGVSTSCASCHVPPSVGPAMLRDTPTLLDVAQGNRFNHDGEFGTLEALITAKLVSSDMGWSAYERDDALSAIRDALLRDDQPEGTYAETFSSAYSLDLIAATPQETSDAVTRALADFVGGLNSTRTAPYDAFGYVNRLQEAAAGPADAKAFGGRIFGRLGNLEGRVLVKFLSRFNELEYQGLKIFFATEGNTKVGNCVTCHYPPYFTDFSFHNTGVTQETYDRLNGAGNFAEFEVPSASEAARPSSTLRAAPIGEDPARADLGHWNFVDVEKSPLRRPDENGESFLDRMVGAFKTPTLRNLSSTAPYMNNGAYATLEEALAQKVRASELAKAGKLRSADDELKLMNIIQEDIPALAAFLRALDEVQPEDYRDLIVKGITIRPVHPM